MESSLLFHSDNLLAMRQLLEQGFEGKIDLVYIALTEPQSKILLFCVTKLLRK